MTHSPALLGLDYGIKKGGEEMKKEIVCSHNVVAFLVLQAVVLNLYLYLTF